MIWFWIILSIAIIPFGVINVVGAPYLPTLKKEQDVAFGMVKLKKKDLIVDLGSGDGTFLINAAERGYRAIGYETNPYLWLVSKIRLLKYGEQANVYYKNFWKIEIPKDTKLLYVFLRDPFMKKLELKLEKEGFKGTLISYAFELPNKKPSKQHRAMTVYKYR